MSGLGVILARDGAPVDRCAMSRLLAAIAHRGADARGVWACDGIALGCVGGGAPARAGDLHVVLDGRIDNAAEVEAKLHGANGGAARAAVHTVAAAYQAWGLGAFERLLGDFVVLAWDARLRRLVCARDIVGVRPFYYCADERRFVGGSELQQLFAAASIPVRPNEGLVGEYLCGRFTSRDETLYRDILRLPPAHALIVDAHGVRTHRYYDPYPGADLRHPSDRECADHFRSVLAAAVRCRVPPAGPIGAYLSGGLDSSSVVCLAAHLRESQAAADRPLVTLSMTASTLEGDERRYVEAVARRWPLQAHRHEPRAPDPELFVDQVKRFRDMAEYPNIAATNGLAEIARGAGCDVVLSGYGGDDWFTAPYVHCAELLARGRVREFVRQLSIERESESNQPLWKTLGRRGLWPLLPGRVRAAISRARRRTAVPTHVAPELARATSLDDRMTPRTPTGRRGASRTRQELYDYFWSGDIPHCLEVEDRHHAWFGLEARHPFHDRRVIEFLLALPEDQRWRGDQTKFVLRRAMGSLLPDEVRLRLTKGDYSHLFMPAFEACGGARCFERLETADRGWVRPDVVRALYRQAREYYLAGDWRYSRHMYKLWTVYGLELWLRHGLKSRE